MRKDFVQCQMVAHTIDKLKQDEREVGWGRPPGGGDNWVRT